MEERREKSEVFSHKVKAGKRTYFFDVKATRAKDYYLTITESVKKHREQGSQYEKHKIFLYKEDLLKFSKGLEEAVRQMQALLPSYDFEKPREREEFSN